MPGPIEAFVADLDGTLLDFEGASHVALNTAAERALGPAPSDGWVSWSLHAEILGTKEEDWSRKLIRSFGATEEQLAPNELVRLWHEEMDKAYAEMPLMPGALEMLRGLRKSHPQAKFAIATSSTRTNFERKMAFHPEVVEFMDVVVTGDEVARGKPNPDIFLEAARRLGVRPDRAVVFEDAPAGVAAGKASGAYVVGVLDPRVARFARSALNSADVVLGSLSDVPVPFDLVS